MLNNSLAAVCAGLLLVTLASCAQDEGSDSQDEATTSSSQENSESDTGSSEPASPEEDMAGPPFGGQCGLFEDRVFRSARAMTGIGAINFDPNRTDQGMENLRPKGFGSYEEWIAEVETVRGAFSEVDKGLLLEEEADNIQTMENSFETSTSMTAAFQAGDTQWYLSTYEAMMFILAACE